MGTLKMKTDTLLEESQTGHLVMCFNSREGRPRGPVYYTFESYPIEKFTSQSSSCETLEPEDQFVWCEVMDQVEIKEEKSYIRYSPKSVLAEVMDKPLKPHARMRTPPYCKMSFSNIGDMVYAVGGHRVSKFPLTERSYNLPKDFSCIRLTTPLRNSKVERLPPMEKTKYLPRIVEIGGRLYVLSAPPYMYPLKYLAFEVYDPLLGTWEDLPEPPFSGVNAEYFSNIELSYIVIGAKLYVSTRDFSCVFDTVSKKWEACELFSDAMQPKDLAELSDWPGCGPPFPFSTRAVVYKEKYLMCIGSDDDASFLAFRIIDGKKAVPVPFEFDGFLPEGYFDDGIIDLGDDNFVAMSYKIESDSCVVEFAEEYYVRMVTFKVVEGNGGDGLRGIILSVHRCMVMNKDVDEGKWRFLFYAFVLRP